MLDQVNLFAQMDKKEYKTQKKTLEAELGRLQRECAELSIPVMVVFEGWGASGKGTLINRLITPLDPRGFKVYTIKKETEEERMRPFLWRFFTKTPQNGKMAIFDRSWYRWIIDNFNDKESKEQVLAARHIEAFEKQLTDSGCVIIKLFLHISEQEQAKRFETLMRDEKTAWRVTKQDLLNNEHYKRDAKRIDKLLEITNTSFAPWTVIPATDKQYATIQMMTAVSRALREKINAIKNGDMEQKNIIVSKPKPILENVDLSLMLQRTEYQKRLKALTNRMGELHNQIYLKRIPVIIVFEGQDASGKGGAIKRITENLDPRGYEVVPTPAPTPEEKAHHYLWRFYNTIPKAGHITIYDRSWYGRVLVERIEGFCTQTEWMRAYEEINQMEEHLVSFGCVLVKFWMQIDKDEQKNRFDARMQDPDKQWKITQEDWRNRAKWDEYITAADDMLIRTSTPYAPWTIVEANNKLYARIKTLETLTSELEKRIKK